MSFKSYCSISCFVQPAGSPASPGVEETGEAAVADAAGETEAAAASTEAPAPPAVVPKAHSATPNLSAWFKAFGAPKNPMKRKMSDSESKTTSSSSSGWTPAVKKAALNVAPAVETKVDVPWYARTDEKKTPVLGSKAAPPSLPTDVAKKDDDAAVEEDVGSPMEDKRLFIDKGDFDFFQ